MDDMEMYVQVGYKDRIDSKVMVILMRQSRIWKTKGIHIARALILEASFSYSKYIDNQSRKVP